jgi:hypothetical protein
MRRTLAVLTALGALAIAGIPNATAADTSTEAATAPYVTNHLIAQYRTSDGREILTALCKPQNAFFVKNHAIYAIKWNCMETDTANRVFWINVHVAPNPGTIDKPLQYKCSAKFSTVPCP